MLRAVVTCFVLCVLGSACASGGKQDVVANDVSDACMSVMQLYASPPAAQRNVATADSVAREAEKAAAIDTHYSNIARAMAAFDRSAHHGTSADDSSLPDAIDACSSLPA